MTKDSSDYFAAQATYYRDLVTMLFSVFGLIISISLGLIAAQVANSSLVGKLSGDVYSLLFAGGVIVILILAFGLKMVLYDWRAARAKEKEPASQPKP